MPKADEPNAFVFGVVPKDDVPKALVVPVFPKAFGVAVAEPNALLDPNAEVPPKADVLLLLLLEPNAELPPNAEFELPPPNADVVFPNVLLCCVKLELPA